MEFPVDKPGWLENFLKNPKKISIEMIFPTKNWETCQTVFTNKQKSGLKL